VLNSDPKAQQPVKSHVASPVKGKVQMIAKHARRKTVADEKKYDELAPPGTVSGVKKPKELVVREQQDMRSYLEM
jgi:hypothetical protein